MAIDEPVYHRNYVLEMRRMIDEYTIEGPYNSANVATEIIRKLTETDKDLLVGWLLLQAKDVLRNAINRRDASIRQHARRTAQRAAFSDAAKRFNEGDSEALGGFLDVVHVTADGLRKRLSEMTSKDLLFVADAYSKRAEQNAMQAAFLAALARKLETSHGEKVSDVYDEQRLAQMWMSIAEESNIREAKKSMPTRATRTRARTHEDNGVHHFVPPPGL